MSENPVGAIIGIVSSTIIGMLLFITFAMVFDVLHRTFPTPIDYQAWNSFVASFSLISAAETLGLFLAVISPILVVLGLEK